MAGMATTASEPPWMGSGTRSIAVLGRTSTKLPRTTMWTAVAKRRCHYPSALPIHPMGIIGIGPGLCELLRTPGHNVRAKFAELSRLLKGSAPSKLRPNIGLEQSQNRRIWCPIWGESVRRGSSSTRCILPRTPVNMGRGIWPRPGNTRPLRGCSSQLLSLHGKHRQGRRCPYFLGTS